MENKYKLHAKTLARDYIVKDWQKLIEYTKRKNKETSEYDFIYSPVYNIVVVKCITEKDGDRKYECEVRFYKNKKIEVTYLSDDGDKPWEFDTFEEAKDELEKDCKEKIIKLLNYIIDLRIVEAIRN